MHDFLVQLIHRFGAIGVGLGAGLEGEAAVVLGGLLARHGAFAPLAAAIAAWLGSFAADQIFFTLGRSQRDGKFVGRVAARPAFRRALDFIHRHPLLFCLAFRFVYGFRVAGPVAIGVSRIPARLFLLLNCLSAAVWAAIFTSLGYHFGLQVERLLKSLLTPGNAILLFAAVITMLLCLYAWHSRRESEGESIEAPADFR